MTGRVWQEDAACKRQDPGVYFDIAGGRRSGRVLCHVCPVVQPCLWSAMVEENRAAPRFGIRGGTMPCDRHRLAQLITRPQAVELLDRSIARWAQPPPAAS